MHLLTVIPRVLDYENGIHWEYPTRAEPMLYPWKTRADTCKSPGFFMGWHGLKLVNFCLFFFHPRTSPDRSELQKFNICIWHPHEPRHHMSGLRVILYCMIDSKADHAGKKPWKIKCTVFSRNAPCIPIDPGNSQGLEVQGIYMICVCFPNGELIVGISYSWISWYLRQLLQFHSCCGLKSPWFRWPRSQGD